MAPKINEATKMIRVEPFANDTNVYISFVLIDRENKTNQMFDDGIDRIPLLAPVEANKEIIRILRDKFERLMKTLEYTVEHGKRPEHVIEIGNPVDGFELTNNWRGL